MLGQEHILGIQVMLGAAVRLVPVVSQVKRSVLVVELFEVESHPTSQLSPYKRVAVPSVQFPAVTRAPSVDTKGMLQPVFYANVLTNARLNKLVCQKLSAYKSLFARTGCFSRTLNTTAAHRDDICPALYTQGMLQPVFRHVYQQLRA